MYEDVNQVTDAADKASVDSREFIARPAEESADDDFEFDPGFDFPPPVDPTAGEGPPE